MIKQLKVDFDKQKELFRVAAKDDSDKSYFIFRAQNEITSHDCYWCKANKPLNLGEVINGYLHLDRYSQSNKLPQLII